MAVTDVPSGELAISIPWQEVEKESKRILKVIAKQARIPGFRPGKAPASVIKLRYAEEWRAELLDALVPRHFWKQAEERQLKVIGSPDIVDVRFEENEPLSFKARFDLIPEFELGDYLRLEAPFREPEASEEEIEGELESLRERHSSYRNLDPRPLADGDIAVVSLKSGDVAGVPRVDQKETTITIGAEHTLAGFSEALRGKSPGEELDFEVAYPEDFGNQKLAGKTVPFHAEVKGLRVKDLPELNDEFAQDIGEFSTLDELKTRIREEIETYKRREAIELAKEAILDKLVASHEFDAPSKLVERQLDSRLRRLAQSLAEQGADPKQLDWDEMRENGRDRAVRDVKAGLLLERIGAAESITASDDEIDERVKRYAEANQLSLAGARKRLAEHGELDRIRGAIENDKTLNFLFDEAEKVDPPQEEPAPEEPAAEEAAPAPE